MLRSVFASRVGSGLLEAIVSAGLLITVVAGLLPLVLVASWGTARLRVAAQASALALDRLAHLQALHHFQAGPALIIDTGTLPKDGGFVGGGRGLTATGAGALQVASPGASEWLDARGAWLADGSQPAPGTAQYERRWGVIAPVGEPCLQLWVEVRTRAAPATVAAAAGGVQCPWGVTP